MSRNGNGSTPGLKLFERVGRIRGIATGAELMDEPQVDRGELGTLVAMRGSLAGSRAGAR
jgi:hypothetical protein